MQKFEIPRKIHLCAEIWTVDTGLLTDALKLKRRPLEQAYGDQLKQMYSRNGISK